MDRLYESLVETFGVEQLPHALFYEFECALRFDLGGEASGIERPVARFMTALDRARSLSAALFEGSAQLHARISCYGAEEADVSVLEPLGICGLEEGAIRRLASIAEPDDMDDDEPLYRHWFGVRIPDLSVVNDLLWLSLAKEMPIEPRASRFSSYIVDIDRAIVLHAYDDRGIDVIAMDRKVLLPLYRSFKDWLLPHDLPRMKAVFETDD